MRVEVTMEPGSLAEFEARCQVAIRSIGNGARYATEAACQEIMADSEIEVPKDTWTMMSSGFWEVHKRSDVGGSRFEGIIGYGGNGDPVNPKTGQAASTYMVALHEDLSKYHPNGKAKFLEDPVRRYAQGRFYRTIFDYAHESLAFMGGK